MRQALSSLALALVLLSNVPALAQVAASPQDQAYCEKYYRLGFSAHLNCVLNSRTGELHGDPFTPLFPPYRSY